MSWTRNPAETSLPLTQNSRVYLPRSDERNVFDADLRDRYTESPHWPGLVWIAMIFFAVATLVVAFWIVQHR